MDTKARILILEDEPKIGTAIERGLVKSGFAAEWMEDSEKALKHLLETDPYDLIVLDLMMPRVDGWTITRTVRDAGVMTPILILTARGETEFKTELLSTGADDYLVKPFSFDELVARATALLRRPTDTLSSRLEIGNIILDSAKRTVKVSGTDVALTPREFALLELFMRHPNETLSRTRLMEHAFPRESAATSSVLDVHMKNLRGKLGDVFSTIRGVGYRLNA